MNKKKNSVEYNLFADFGTVDEGNIIAGAVMQAIEETQNHEPEKKLQRIEDFGEKIGGARKDLYAAYLTCRITKNFWRTRRYSAEAEKIFVENKRMGG